MRKLLLLGLVGLSCTLMSAFPANQTEVTKVPPTETIVAVDLGNAQSSVENIAVSKGQNETLQLTKKQEKKLDKIAKKARDGNKSWLTAVLLAFFLGTLGIHRFYLGYTWQGIVQLLTLGGLGIWALIDFIRIIIRDLQPKNGEYND